MTIDRAVGGACLAVAAAVITAGVVLGASTGPPAERRGPVDDPATTEAFVELLDGAARGAWKLDAEWVRRQGDEVTLEREWREVQDGTGNELIAAFGGLTGSFEGRLVKCGAFGEETLCDAGPAPDPEPRFERASVRSAELVEPRTGDYTVARSPERTIAGQRADCFVLHRRPERTADFFGEEARYCFSAEGIPLLVVQRRGAVVDTRTATSASTDVDRGDFVELLESQAAEAERSRVRSGP